MSRRIYVAGASKEAAFVEHVIEKLKEAGWTITFDWTEKLRTQRVPEHELTPEEAEEIAHACLDGVEEADVFWLLAPQVPSVGSWVELGHAIREGQERTLEVLISGACPSVFAVFADTRFPTHLEALLQLEERGRDQDALKCAACGHGEYHCIASGCNHVDEAGEYCECETFVPRKERA